MRLYHVAGLDDIFFRSIPQRRDGCCGVGECGGLWKYARSESIRATIVLAAVGGRRRARSNHPKLRTSPGRVLRRRVNSRNDRRGVDRGVRDDLSESAAARWYIIIRSSTPQSILTELRHGVRSSPPPTYRSAGTVMPRRGGGEEWRHTRSDAINFRRVTPRQSRRNRKPSSGKRVCSFFAFAAAVCSAVA